MEVKIARTAGFCWGVRRTVDKVMEVADHAGRPVVTLGPIIHNPQAVTRMREKGVGTVERVAEVGDGTTVVVRTHGAVKPELESARERGLDVVDGTCPYVKYPQAIAQRLSRDGYHLVIVGDADHAEVKGVVSYVEGACTVVKPGGPIPEITAQKVAVIAQTTCIGADFERVVGALALRHKEVRAVNTICSDTEEREEQRQHPAPRRDLPGHPAPHLARRDRGRARAVVVRRLPRRGDQRGGLDSRLGRGRRGRAPRHHRLVGSA
jgi:4-hydroxy-3-methylbut-2-enyl diphosphate reductase